MASIVVTFKEKDYLVSTDGLKTEFPYDLILVDGNVKIVPWQDDFNRTAEMKSEFTYTDDGYKKGKHVLADGSGEYMYTLRTPAKSHMPSLFNVEPGHENKNLQPAERWM